MIVCVCRGVSDRDLNEAVRGGARSLDDIARHCDGAGTECGSCRRFIQREVLADSLRQSA